MRSVTVAAPLVLAMLAARPTAAQTVSGPARFEAREILAPSAVDLFPYAPFAGAATADAATADAAPAGLPLPKYGRWVGITKWFTLAAAAGLGALGVSLHNDANALFDRLNRLCEADADNCRSRNPDGSYTDPVLETMYQNVISKDRQARSAFIGTQVAFGATVLLFIVDFQKKKGPANEPYDPDAGKGAFRLSAAPGQVTVRWYVR
jgi:hypothetical protein